MFIKLKLCLNKHMHTRDTFIFVRELNLFTRLTIDYCQYNLLVYCGFYAI